MQGIQFGTCGTDLEAKITEGQMSDLAGNGQLGQT